MTWEEEREEAQTSMSKPVVELVARGLQNLAKYAAVLGIGGSAVAASLYNVDGGERVVLFDR